MENAEAMQTSIETEENAIIKLSPFNTILLSTNGKCLCCNLSFLYLFHFYNIIIVPPTIGKIKLSTFSVHASKTLTTVTIQINRKLRMSHRMNDPTKIIDTQHPKLPSRVLFVSPGHLCFPYFIPVTAAKQSPTPTANIPTTAVFIFPPISNQTPVAQPEIKYK